MARAAPIVPDPLEARGWLLEELARAEYATGESLLLRLLRWLWNFFASLSGLQPPSWQLLVIGVGLLALVVGISWRVAGPVRLARRTGATLVFGSDDARTADQLRADAAELARLGDWAGAVVAQFRALVRGTQQRLATADQPGLTAKEAVVSIATAFPNARRELDWAGQKFDLVQYSESGQLGSEIGKPSRGRHQVCDSTDYLRMRQLDAELQGSRPAHGSRLSSVSAVVR